MTELYRLIDRFGRFLRWRTDTITLEVAMDGLEELPVVRQLIMRRAADAEARGEANLLERVRNASPDVVRRASSLVLRIADADELAAELEQLLPA